MGNVISFLVNGFEGGIDNLVMVAGGGLLAGAGLYGMISTDIFGTSLVGELVGTGVFGGMVIGGTLLAYQGLRNGWFGGPPSQEDLQKDFNYTNKNARKDKNGNVIRAGNGKGFVYDKGVKGYWGMFKDGARAWGCGFWHTVSFGLGAKECYKADMATAAANGYNPNDVTDTKQYTKDEIAAMYRTLPPLTSVMALSTGVIVTNLGLNLLAFDVFPFDYIALGMGVVAVGTSLYTIYKYYSKGIESDPVSPIDVLKDVLDKDKDAIGDLIERQKDQKEKDKKIQDQQNGWTDTVGKIGQGLFNMSRQNAPNPEPGNNTGGELSTKDLPTGPKRGPRRRK